MKVTRSYAFTPMRGFRSLVELLRQACDRLAIELATEDVAHIEHISEVRVQFVWSMVRGDEHRFKDVIFPFTVSYEALKKRLEREKRRIRKRNDGDS